MLLQMFLYMVKGCPYSPTTPGTYLFVLINSVTRILVISEYYLQYSALWLTLPRNIIFLRVIRCLY